MAQAPSRSQAFSMLEEGVHLLRRAGFRSLVCHWTGSVPAALAVTMGWYLLMTGPVSDADCAAGALVVALVVVWMNCRRAVFAGRLRRVLSGAPETPWTRSRLMHLAGIQAFCAATKPIALLLSALVLLPFARTVATYRSIAALSDRDDLDPREILRRSRRAAAVDPGQTWLLLPLLALLQVAVLVNVALTLAILPQLVRMLTGYESTFSRGGQFFVQSPLFYFFAIAVGWILFDPYVQAVHCVREFQAESRETGEDIRAGLRMARVAATAIVLALCATVAHAATPIAPGDLEQSVRQTMDEPAYSWHIAPHSSQASGKPPWIVTFTDKVVNATKNVFKAIGRAITRFLDWLLQHLGVEPNSKGGAMPRTGLHWSIYVLIGVILIAIAWVVYRRRLFQRRAAQRVEADPVTVVHLEEEGITADQLPEEKWLELAAECLSEENLRLALRAYFLASLAWLGRIEIIAIHPGKTNREYALEVRRRTRATPDASAGFEGNIASFERAWYGGHEVSAEQIEEFRARVAAMKSLVTPLVEVAA